MCGKITPKHGENKALHWIEGAEKQDAIYLFIFNIQEDRQPPKQQDGVGKAECVSVLNIHLSTQKLRAVKEEASAS